MPDTINRRRRARQACVACNEKRIKCNVTEEIPCRNCARADVPCRTRESRRGKQRQVVPLIGVDAGTEDPRSQREGHRDSITEVAGSAYIAEKPDSRLSTVVGSAESDDVVPEPLNTPIQSRPDVVLPEAVNTLVEGRLDDDQSVFLGESTSIRYVNAHFSRDPRWRSLSDRLLHRVPPASSSKVNKPAWEIQRDQRKLEIMRSEGTLCRPDDRTVSALLRCYFRWFHPCFAIADEQMVWRQLRDLTLSPLFLNALLFVGTIHMTDEDLQSMSLGSKDQAKHLFFNRAKDLYSADFEQNKMPILQSLFLMSFWRAEPCLEKDARYWLGAAISLAQTNALHRSTGPSTKSLDGLKKRLWWSLYVRERQCAAALGLPSRISDDDCDIPPLQRSDFDGAFGDDVSTALQHEYAEFQIGMTELIGFLGQIILCGYLPRATVDDARKADITERLLTWRRQLPRIMQSEDDIGSRTSLYVSMLHLAYNNLLILLYRSNYLESQENDRGGVIALQAAARNARIIEDLLAENKLISHGQVHMITNLFNTLCIHTIHLRSSEGTSATIAEHRAKVCLLGLRELQHTWEVRNWILQLFFHYLDRSTASRLLPPGNASGTPLARSRLQSRRGSVSRETHAFDATAAGTEINQQGGGEPDRPVAADTARSLSTDEQHELLFSQIENSFVFGEGVMDWDQDFLLQEFAAPYKESEQVLAAPLLPDGPGAWMQT
jgi:hypothetical protein